MQTRNNWQLTAAAFALVILLVGVVFAAPGGGNAFNVTVTDSDAGPTELDIGAVEGCARFDVNEMLDLGITNYRIYAGMARLEPHDDDGVYGEPTIDEVKADPDVIDWTQWDEQFHLTDTYFWSEGCPGGGAQISLHDQLVQLRDNGIKPVVTLRNVNNNDDPEWAHQLNPPETQEDWNEWWEHVFAWVYWANVKNDLQVHDWQVHNEPDALTQGWDGKWDDYVLFTQFTADAIQFVYDTYLPDETFTLYAPVAANPDNEYVPESIKANDDIIDSVDFHEYGDPVDTAEQIHGQIDELDSDGVHEWLYLSEWGTFRSKYESVKDTLTWMTQLRNHNVDSAYIRQSSIFPLYDWTNNMRGIIAPDGSKQETYWGFRLMIRGLQNGKQEYVINDDIPNNKDIHVIAAEEPSTGTLYVELINQGNNAEEINLDLSAHASTGTVTFREYSDTFKDEETGTASLDNGTVGFSLPGHSIVQVILP